jgi:hypothetical protein
MIKMKKILFIATLVSLGFLSDSFSQPVTQPSPLSPLLTHYYGVKDALVAGDAKVAATKAGEMWKAINGVNIGALSPSVHTTFMSVKDKLAMDARHISEVTNISHQREHFASLSSNMVVLAKATPLSGQPVYEEYCPMKKASWLSIEAEIKNPYFGSAMLTCGKVTATFK